MKIAICDDNLEDIRYLEKLILESGYCLGERVFNEFLSGEELLDNFSKFDIIFLDIKLDGMEGTEVAEAIRLRDAKVPIAFYTGYEASASRIFKVRPLSYLIKGKKELKSLVNKTLQELCEEQKRPDVLVEYDGKMYVLQLSDILYVSISDKGSAIFLTDEKAYELFGKNQDSYKQEHIIKSGVRIEAYYDQLSRYGFLYAKKSYIINAQHVIARGKDSVLLKGHYELSVARSKKKEFDSQLVKYWGDTILGKE